MIEFIYGLPSSGKTTLLYEKIKETLKKGGDAVLIVPDQEALDAEAALARFCRDVPTVKLRVYGFSRLSDDVFRRYGGVSYKYVDKTGQTLAVFLAVCSVLPALKVYGKTSPSDHALLSSVLSAVRELKRQGVSVPELEAAAGAVSSPSLKDKLDDMCLLMPAYEKIIKTGGDDPDDALSHMYRVLTEHGGMPEADIFIDSFISFTGMQMKIIELFMRTCKSVTVTFGIPYGKRPDILSPVYDSEKRLSAAAARCGDIVRTALDGSYASHCMTALEKCLSTGEKSEIKAGDNIRFYRAKTAFDEAEFVAADIRKRLQNGCRCRDIAILTNSIQTWRGIIDAALEQYGVPYFMSSRDDAKQKALFRLVLSALHVCVNDFRCKDVVGYVKTGLLNAPADGLDLFDDYITRRDIHGIKAFGEDFSGSPYSYGVPDIGDENALSRLQTVNQIRAAVITPLIDLSEKLKECTDAKSISVALSDFLLSIEITETLGWLIAGSRSSGDTAEAEETEQLWSVFVRISEQICFMCGSLPMNAAQYMRLFETVLSDTDIGKIPTSTDQVTVGEAGMLRVRGVKHVYLIGCNEGEFPAGVSDTGIFDDNDRELLSDAGVDLPGMSDDENERKIYDFYRCATAAKETVTFSYNVCAPNGAEKYPCHILSEIKRAFPDIELKHGLTVFDIAASKQSLFEYYAENRNTKFGKAAQKLLEKDGAWADKISMLDTPITEKNDKLDKETAGSLMPGAIRLSPTRLSSFTGCAFAHCCKYFLKLDDGGAVSFDTGEFGSFLHYVLKRLIDDRMARLLPSEPTDGELYEKIDKYVNEYCRHFLHADPNAAGMGRFRAALKNLKKCAVKAAKDIINELNTGKFTPVATELRISDVKGVTPYMIQLENGKKTYLTGVIDRVDAYEKDGVTYIKLVDYKTGDVKFDLSSISECDKSVQLFAYMLTVCTSKGKFEHPAPAALFYMQTVPSYPTVNGSGDETAEQPLNRGGIALSEPQVADALEPGLAEKKGKIYKLSAGSMVVAAPDEMTAVFEEVKTAIADAALRMCEGDASVTGVKSSAPCTYCPYMTVCRYTERKERRRG